MKRPTISAAGTSEEWAYFLQRWSDYKAATHLTGSDIVYQLLECCDEMLRKDLTRTFGALASSDESTILKNIKTLAVRQENVMVAREQLQQMRQDRDEPVRAFSARLRGQAGVCSFTVGCTCTAQVDYSDIMVRDALIRGLADEEIRLDILGESKQDMSLEEVLMYVETKESGKRSAGRLLGDSTTATAAVTSSYRRQEKGRLHGKPSEVHTTTPPCGHCGKPGHGRSRRNASRSAQPMATHALNVGSHTTTRPNVASPSAGSSPPSPPHHHHNMMQPQSLRPFALWTAPRQLLPTPSRSTTTCITSYATLGRGGHLTLSPSSTSPSRPFPQMLRPLAFPPLLLARLPLYCTLPWLTLAANPALPAPRSSPS